MIREVEIAVLSLLYESDESSVERDTLYRKARSRGIEKELVDEGITNLLMNGKLVEPVDGELELVGSPSLLSDRRKSERDADRPTPVGVLQVLAKVAKEEGYEQIHGCVAFAETHSYHYPTTDSEKVGYIHGIGFDQNTGTRYVFLVDGDPWEENIRIEEARDNLRVEYYMDQDPSKYVHVYPESDEPFWTNSPMSSGHDMSDWPPEFD